MASVVAFILTILRILFTYVQSSWRLIFPNPRKNVKGKVVLVTGAGRGIGKCLSKQFAHLGCTLVLWDINKDEVENTASDICSQGGTAYAYTCDVSNYNHIQQTAAAVRRDVHHIDIVINNAGIMLVKRFLDLTPDEVQKVFTVNAISHFWINREFLPYMIEQNSGHIVTIASMAGKGAAQLVTDYCASKHAAVGLSEALAEELRVTYKRLGVKVTTVYPMFVNTQLLHQHNGRIRASTGMEDVLEPAQVASNIIDGVLRNKSEIYLPNYVGNIGLARALLPKRAQHILADYLHTGFYEIEIKTYK